MSKNPLPNNLGWSGAGAVDVTNFRCGWCDANVGAHQGYTTNVGVNVAIIRLCPLCKRPTYFEQGEPYPGVAFGDSVAKLPPDVAAVYDEARRCCSNSAYTAAVLLLRKLLMNVAVNKGAAEGKKFIEYIEYLSDKNYVPPDGKGWVDHIRKKGNEATHEITLMTKTDAEELVMFAEMLLKFIYEFPSWIPQVAKTP